MSDKVWISCTDTPVFVLCEPPDESIPLQERGEHHGLLLGKGDPLLAGLRSHLWAVVKVSSYYEIESPYGGCVAFDNYEIVFEGKRPDAIRVLIENGADPAEIPMEVAIGAGLRLADTGNWGTAVASAGGVAMSGDRGYSEANFKGIARTGDDGYAEVADHGIAWADEGGTAKAAAGGVAIIDGDRFGTAEASDRGIAIGQGRKNFVRAGDAGIAITWVGGKVNVGNQGIAISRVGEGVVQGGENSIVIGNVVSGGLGSLLVSRRWILDTNTDHIAFGFVGQNGLQPYVKYIASTDGVLTKVEDLEFQEGVASIGRLHDAYQREVAEQNSEGSSNE